MSEPKTYTLQAPGAVLQNDVRDNGRLSSAGQARARGSCPLLRPDPAQRPRLAEIRDNLIARIAEAQREG